jgi:ABC-type polar amino acid transport system ATPase subunit
MEDGDGVVSSALAIDRLKLRRGAREILSEVSFSAAPGAIVALMGLSGSGKTTVLRAVAGLEAFDEGEIRIGPVVLRSGTAPAAHPRELRRQVGMVFQFHHLFEHLTAIENVLLAATHVQRRTRADAETAGRRLLDELGVGSRAGALPRELSGGEAQRVAIARAVALDPPLLLLDEPTASLDPARRGDLGASLRALAAAGRTLLFTCHDAGFVRDFATDCLILSAGTVVEHGEPASVLDHPAHDATRALLRLKTES